MKRIILVSSFLFIFTSFLSLNAQWARTYGGSNSDEAESIQQTSDGGYIVAGDHSGDIWILKLSPDGDIEWQKTYGGGGASSIQQTSDGGYIVAGGGRDFRILKLSPDGEVEWQKAYGGSGSDSASSIQQTSDGGYIVAGVFDIYGSNSDILVLKLSSTGDIEWQKTYGGSWWEEAPSIQQTSDGGYIVAMQRSFGAGVWILKLTFDGDIEWQKTYGGSGASSIQQTSDGGYVVAGYAQFSIAGHGDIWVSKLSSIGTIEWQKTYGDESPERASSIQQTSDGGYIVAGQAYAGGGGRDFWILKLSPDGEIEWQKAYGGSAPDSASSIQQTSDGGYIVAGFTISWGAGSEDFWVLKLSSDGIINPRCSFMINSNAEVSDTYVLPVVTNTTPRDTNITPQETNITPQDTNATVYNLCSEKPLLSILLDSTIDILIPVRGATDPAPGTYIYDLGAEVTITAFPFDGYYFGCWSGDASGETNPITIIVDSDKSIIVYFRTPTRGYGDGGGGGKKGSCFIATAAYGSPLHPHLDILRDFRDRYLMPSKIGRKIVDLYYKYSPFAADFIAKHKALKAAVRINFLPLIAFSYLILHFGPLITAAMLALIFMLPVFLIWHYKRKLEHPIKI